MAINPYQLVQSQLGLTEQLLGAEQKKRASQIETGAQMSKMQGEFEEQIRIAQEKAEAELRKKKKKGKFGGLGKIAAMFAGPIAGPIISGLLAMDELKGQSKHAQRQGQLAKAQALGVDTSRFGKTFLGKAAKDYKYETAKGYDDMIREADVGFGDLLTAGLASGIQSMATNKIGEGIKGGIKDIRAAKDITGTISEGGLDIKDIAAEDASKALDLLSDSQKGILESLGGIEGVTKLSEQGYLKNILEQMKKPSSAGLEEGQTNFLQQLLMMFR